MTNNEFEFTMKAANFTAVHTDANFCVADLGTSKYLSVVVAVGRFALLQKFFDCLSDKLSAKVSYQHNERYEGIYFPVRVA